VILLLIYSSLPSPPFLRTLLLCASPGVDGGNPRPSTTTGDSLNRTAKRPSLRFQDRLFWVTLARFWQDWPYAERLIGSIRRECLDHVIVLSEEHLRRILKKYFFYYHNSNGVMYVMNGRALYAIRLAEAKGDVTAAPQGFVWKHDRNAPWIPSPLLYGDALYFLKGNTGILSVFNAKTGETL
jgi:hypothetical protein